MTARGAYVALTAIAAVVLATFHPLLALAWCIAAGLAEPLILED